MWGSKGWGPEAQEFIKNVVEKSMEIGNFLEIYINYERILDLEKLI